MKEIEGKILEQNPREPSLSQGGKKIAIIHDAFLYRGGGHSMPTSSQDFSRVGASIRESSVSQES
jgi:hypothetical protein